MDWNGVDERLIRRGELLLSLEFVETYHEDLKGMNLGKVGRPFKLTDQYVEFLSAVRYLFSMPYRQLEGFTRGLHRLVPKLPPVDYSGLRRRILNLNHPLYNTLQDSGEPLAIAVDSTGVGVHRAGGWVERKHGKKKRYVKIHLAVNVETKEIVAMQVTTDDVHDSRVFHGLLEEAEEHGTVVKVYGDGAYDSSQIYELLEREGVEPVVKPRRNSRVNTPSPARRRVVRLFQRLGAELWSKLKGYGRRWMVETAYSTFKRLFGEHCMANTFLNITKELATKASLYNTLINL